MKFRSFRLKCNKSRRSLEIYFIVTQKRFSMFRCISLTTFLIFTAYSSVFSQKVYLSTVAIAENKHPLEIAFARVDTVVIDDIGIPWELGPYKGRVLSNKVLIFEKGVVIHASKGQYPDTNDSMFEFIDSENLQILGFDNTLAMNKPEYEGGEWRHVISIRGCKNVTIKNLKLLSSGGDGIYIAGSKKNNYSLNILVDNIMAVDNYRQGLSLISGKNIQITRSVFSETSGTLPSAGVDIEPNSPRDIIQNVIFQDCKFVNNDNAGVLISLHQLNESSAPVSLEFESCYFSGNAKASKIHSEIIVKDNPEAPIRGQVVFKDCFFENLSGHLLYSRKLADSFVVILKDIAVRATNDSPLIYLEVPDYYSDKGDLGNITFDTLFISQYVGKAPIMKVRGSKIGTLSHLRDVNIKLVIENLRSTIIRTEYINYSPSDNINVKLNLIEIDSSQRAGNSMKN